MRRMMRSIWRGVGGVVVLAVLVAIIVGIVSTHTAHATSAHAHTTCPPRTVAQEQTYLQTHQAGEMATHLKSVTFSCQVHGSGPNWGGLVRSIPAPSR